MNQHKIDKLYNHMQEEVEYYPPTRQNYQYKVLIY